MLYRRTTVLASASLFAFAIVQAATAAPPTRKFDAPGAPDFVRLDAGASPPLDVDGNFLIGPDYTAAPETKVVDGVPQGKIVQFTIDSKETKLLNPGIARKVFGKVDPANPKTLIVETHQIDYKRQITVYIPTQYVRGSEAPFMVCHDGPKGKPKMTIPHILDNLIHQKRVPAIIAIMVANGGGDAQGHERGKEYDTMSGLFAEYIETEVLPRVEKNCDVKLTKDPDGRSAMGSSSGGSAALAMAWYRTDLYHRVLTTSGTFINQQWPFNPETPDGAWGFHKKIIPESPKKPLRIYLAVGDRDLLNPNVMRDGMHDWVEANHRMAKVLKEKGYPYQYLFCQNSGHGVGNAKAQFLPHAIEWVWQGYKAPEKDTVAAKSKRKQVLLGGKSFTLNGRPAFLMGPAKSSDSDTKEKEKPWIFYGPTLAQYPDKAESWMHQQFIDAGIAVAGIDVGEAYGSPHAFPHFEALYQKMVNDGYSSKPALLGRSRGGLWVSSWAIEHPDRVAAIGGIYPCYDYTTYPGAKRAAAAYHASEQILLDQQDELNPIKRSYVLAEAKIPVFIIHGSDDKVVPLAANSAALEKTYESKGVGDLIEVMKVDGQGHSFWPGYFRCQELVDFLKAKASGK